ncbi:hypothetical protein BpHYR1_011784 [Brachionus plicatilis]|uniref:Uncharacterized protein n=1 Tax=Brachionus plicatilis TaxID=10195 RepID=A0A3M7RU73_BRAPC|nr:hypothetical protein BpHYR1_011784 [Brachionus plicatilis]
MEEAFSLLEDWPSVPGQSTDTLKKMYKYVMALVSIVKAQKEQIKEMTTEITELKKNKKEATTSAPLDWSKIMAGEVHKDKNAVAMMATMANEMKKKAERANNVIAAIPAELCTEGGDDALVKSLTSEIGVAESRVIKTRRIRGQTTGNTANMRNTNERVLIVLEMESVDAKMAILRNAKKLRESQNKQYKKVYINEDRTPNERAADKLREERDTRNAKLKESSTINGRELKFETGNDGKKRFLGIRNGELRMVVSTIEQR